MELIFPVPGFPPFFRISLRIPLPADQAPDIHRDFTSLNLRLEKEMVFGAL